MDVWLKEQINCKPKKHDDEYIYHCECGYSAEHSHPWYFYWFGTEHQECLRKKRAAWLANMMVFLQDARAEAASVEHLVTDREGFSVSMLEVARELREELTTLREQVQARDDQVSGMYRTQESLRRDKAVLEARVRLLSGEAPPETDAEYTALAHQAIHFAGGPNT